MKTGTGITVAVDGRPVAFSNPNKVLWPEDGITKTDLAAYWLATAPWALPHLRGRYLVLTRYPDGIHGKSFYQKNLPDHAPPWIRHRPVPSRRSGRTIRYLLGADAATLVWLAGQAAIEIHPWTSPDTHPDRPDFALVDLDPGEGCGFAEAVAVAQGLHRLLQELGLRGWVKTSGATGLHVYIPVAPRYTYDQTADFVRRLGVVLHHLMPGLVTLARPVAERRGRVYVDYLQNARGKTLVAPYCPRPLPGAPVSFPVAWRDLPQIHPRQFTIKTVPGLLHKIPPGADPFHSLLTVRQSLDRALALLAGLGPARAKSPGGPRPLSIGPGCFSVIT